MDCLVQAPNAKGTNTYLYDGFNRRVKQTDAKGTSYSVHKFDTDIGFRNIHSFNRYAYANNSPYNYTVPNGEHPVRWAARVGYKAGTYINMGISLAIQATTESDSLGELIYDSWNGDVDDECFSGFSGCSGE